MQRKKIMTKTQRKEQIIARKNELNEIRDRLPFWGSYAKDIVKYLSDRDVEITENQVYIAVKTGLGSKCDHIIVAMRVLAQKHEQKLVDLVDAE